MNTDRDYHIECGSNGLPVIFRHDDEAGILRGFAGHAQAAVLATMTLAMHYAEALDGENALHLDGLTIAHALNGSHTLLQLAMAMQEEANRLDAGGAA